MLILGLLGMYFDAVVVFVTNSSVLFRLAMAILWISNLSGRPDIFLGSRTIKNMLFTLPIARGLGLNDIFVCFQFTEGTYSFKVKVNVHSRFFHQVVVFTNLFICCFYIQSTSQKRQ